MAIRNLIYKILKESEDDFDWAKELYNELGNHTELPEPDGNRYIIRFSRDVKRSTIEDLDTQLTLLGWRWGEYNVESLMNSCRQSNTAYVHLKPTGQVTFGSNESIFNAVNSVKFDQVQQIFYK